VLLHCPRVIGLGPAVRVEPNVRLEDAAAIDVACHVYKSIVGESFGPRIFDDPVLPTGLINAVAYEQHGVVDVGSVELGAGVSADKVIVVTSTEYVSVDSCLQGTPSEHASGERRLAL